MSAQRTAYRPCIAALPDIQIECVDHTLHGDMVDLSRKGALVHVETVMRLRRQSPCRLRIPGVHQAVNGLVVWRDHDVAGIKFIALQQLQLEEIEQMIMRHAGYPQLLERDVPDLVRACAGHPSPQMR